MSDSSNCGECGKVCDYLLQNGGCDEGACLPSFSGCVFATEPPLSCAEVCAAEGKTCVAQGCFSLNNMSPTTYYFYAAESVCAEGELGVPSDLGCDSPMEASQDYYRCCCQQP